MQSGLVWSGLARSVLPAAPALRLAGTDRGLILSSSIFLYSCFFSFLFFFFTDTQTTVSTTIHHYIIFSSSIIRPASPRTTTTSTQSPLHTHTSTSEEGARTCGRIRRETRVIGPCSPIIPISNHDPSNSHALSLGFSKALGSSSNSRPTAPGANPSAIHRPSHPLPTPLRRSASLGHPRPPGQIANHPSGAPSTLSPSSHLISSRITQRKFKKVLVYLYHFFLFHTVFGHPSPFTHTRAHFASRSRPHSIMLQMEPHLIAVLPAHPTAHSFCFPGWTGRPRPAVAHVSKGVCVCCD